METKTRSLIGLCFWDFPYQTWRSAAQGLCFFSETRDPHFYNQTLNWESLCVSIIANQTWQSAMWGLRLYLTEARDPHFEVKTRELCLFCTTQASHFWTLVSDSWRKDGSQKLKSPRQPKANLFDPPLMDLRDYLIKKNSANQILWLVAVNGSSRQCSLNATAAHMQANSRCSDDWPQPPD